MAGFNYKPAIQPATTTVGIDGPVLIEGQNNGVPKIVGVNDDNTLSQSIPQQQANDYITEMVSLLSKIEKQLSLLTGEENIGE